MAWHLADTESRYYLPSLGLPARPRLPDLLDELAASAEHVRRTLLTAPPDLLRTDRGETWTTTRLLRRLAWHEPAELPPCPPSRPPSRRATCPPGIPPHAGKRSGCRRGKALHAAA